MVRLHASEMTYIVSGRALNSTHSLSARDEVYEPVRTNCRRPTSVSVSKEPLTYQTSYAIRVLQALQKNVVVYRVEGCR